MDIFFLVVSVLFSMAVSLGVGSSTIAIANFFVAISNGVIEPEERKMMGVVYVVLRVAMVLLFLTLTLITGYQVVEQGAVAFTVLLLANWILLLVLYLNAILMTLKVMPSKYGPSIQAGSWYTLGIVNALGALGAFSFSFGTFLTGYLLLIMLATGLVNGLMTYLKSQRANSSPIAPTTAATK